MDRQLLKTEMIKIGKKLADEPAFKSRYDELIIMSSKNDKPGLEFKLKELAKHAQAIESQKKSDPEVIKLKEEMKEASASYKEQTKYNNLQARFIGLLLQELNDFQE